MTLIYLLLYASMNIASGYMWGRWSERAWWTRTRAQRIRRFLRLRRHRGT